MARTSLKKSSGRKASSSQAKTRNSGVSSGGMVEQPAKKTPGSYQGIASAMPQPRILKAPLGAVAAQNPAEAQRRLAYFSERRDLMVANIRELVEIESPSDNKAAVDQLGDVVAVKMAALGGFVR